MNINLNETDLINLDTLLETKLLIQANSGGGKSWLIRKLLEESHGKVQQIVIDLEGEFSTLREKFDYVVAGKGGDTPADPKSAALLARKLLELNVSAIIDLYELDHYQRKHFVKLFLEAMIDAPKDLWHPCIVVIDEAHVFCPEKGQSEASSAVIELATRGRKRGFCAVLATQRLSKLHKDAAAECNNKLIGRTGLDIDRKRAAEELGFTSKDQELSLRTMNAGEFFAFGPAISVEVKKVKVGGVKTSHPKVGSRMLTAVPIPPTSKIKSLLPQLSDLPKEAEEEARTIDDLKKQIFDLKRSQRVQVGVQGIDQGAIDEALKPYIEEMKKAEFGQRELIGSYEDYANKIKNLVDNFGIELSKITPPKMGAMVSYTPVSKVYKIPEKPEGLSDNVDHNMGSIRLDDDKPITGGAMRMLKVLAKRYPMKFTKSQLGTLSKLSPRSGTYGTYFSLLRSKGLIQIDANLISITKLGLEMVGPVSEYDLRTVEMWQGNLFGGARRMFDVLVGNAPKALSKEELGEMVGLSANSGTFGTYLSMLRSNGLVETEGGLIKASETLFI